MSATQFLIPYPIVAKPTNIGAPGSTITFYQPATTTLKAIYTDSTLTTQQANPLTADGAGRWDDIYLDGTTTYKIVIEDKNGAVLFSQDPYTPGVISSITGPAGDVAKAADRTALAAITGQAAGATRYLAESGREGTFVWSTANNAANVTADPQQGIYVAPASATTGASGAWVRKFDGPVSTRWFGADGSGDDQPAIQAAWNYAMANALTFHTPGDDYSLGAPLTIDTDGWHATGDGWENTRLIPTGAFPAVIVSGLFGKAEGVGCWGTASGLGTGVGTYGWVFKNAGGSEIISCQGRNFATDGALVSPTYGGGVAGNNNCLKFVAGGYNANGGAGTRMDQHPDNNNVAYLGVEASGNALDGLIGKSVGGYVDKACIFEGNLGYGVQIGEDGDASFNTGWVVDRPWLESNGLGGVRGSAKSQDNTIRLRGAGQGYTRNASAGDVVELVTSGGLARFGSNDGTTFLQASANASEAYLLAASASAGNVNLNIGGAGTGWLSISGRGQVVDDGDAIAEFNIRPAAAKTGALTFTHPGVADRWGVGIKTADANLYFGDRTLTAPVVTFTSAGAATFASTVAGSNLSGTNTGDGAYTISTKTAGYTETATSGHQVILADLAAGFTIVLPTAVGNKAKITVKKMQSAGSIILDGAGTETIDGGLTATLSNQYESLTLISDNSNWQVI
jgi:hypothetical protein